VFYERFNERRKGEKKVKALAIQEAAAATKKAEEEADHARAKNIGRGGAGGVAAIGGAGVRVAGGGGGGGSATERLERQRDSPSSFMSGPHTVIQTHRHTHPQPSLCGSGTQRGEMAGVGMYLHERTFDVVRYECII